MSCSNDTTRSDRGAGVANGADVPREAGSSARLKVALVIPCFNEEEGVTYLLSRLREAAGVLECRYDVSFVFVDDGSTDSTWDLLCDEATANERITLLRHSRNRGIAAAIMTGIKHVDTDFVCSLDADCTYDPMEVGGMLALLRGDVDVVTASPYHPRGKVTNVPSWRLLLSKCASFLYRRVMKQKLYTYTSCFRAYRRAAVADLTIQREGFVGIAEFLWRVDRRGGRIVEFPVELKTRRLGCSKLRVASVSMGHLYLMSRMLGNRVLGVLARAKEAE